jgi:flagellar motor component MotA
VLDDVFQKARKDGLVGLESHIEDPHNSDTFKKLPFFSNDHDALSFLCDTLKVLLDGRCRRPSGFGIFAAVHGVVITMGSIGARIGNW